MHFRIEIEPQSYKRPRLSSINGHSHVHNDRKYTHYKRTLQMLLKSEIIKQSLQQTVEQQQTKPLSLACKFYLTPPKSLIRKTSEPWKTTPHTCKPDLDNLVKALLDACNEILYKDDSQVVEIHATKEYDINPHIEIETR